MTFVLFKERRKPQENLYTNLFLFFFSARRWVCATEAKQSRTWHEFVEVVLGTAGLTGTEILGSPVNKWAQGTQRLLSWLFFSLRWRLGAEDGGWPFA